MIHGVTFIVRFNWPLYAAAAVSVAAAVPAISRVPPESSWRILLLGAAGLALYWSGASLAASWLVYDRSPLMTWSWIPQALGFRPQTWINVHGGLDQSTSALHSLLGGSGRVFDIFDSAQMTEGSILRARRLGSGVPAEPVDYRRLPAPADSVDAFFLLLSAHELRSHDARCVLFRELRRILTPDGRVIVAEHLRDWANVAAYGPGALHFHSRRTWLRCFHDAGFVVTTEFSITPLVRVFVLGRLP